MRHQHIFAFALLASTAIVATPASASLFTIDYYSSYTETPTGVSVSGTPFFSEGVDDVTYIDFSDPSAPAGRPDASGPFAAIITGVFTIDSTSQIFTIGSDDGAYLFLDNMLVGSNPGIHSYSTLTYNAAFSPGTYDFRVEYFNGPCCGAQVGISAQGVTFQPTDSVPEPATWAMFIGGFGLVGGALRRSRAQTTSVRFA